MGTWGSGIFDNDPASDVLDEFRELIEDGVESKTATSQIMRTFAYRLDDPDEGPAFWTGLDVIQAGLGRLEAARKPLEVCKRPAYQVASDLGK